MRAAGAHGFPAGQVRLDLEGGFALQSARAGRQPPLSVQRVLAFLALHDRPLLRGYVAGSLWPGSSESRAAASLRTSIWRLQKVGPSPVVASSSHLSLAADVVVDVRETMDVARSVLNGRARELARREFELLVDGHDLLPDWYDEWVIMEREYMREQRVRALEVLCEQLTGEARYAEASQAGLAAIACEPLRESSHRALINLHLSEGNPGEAVRRYSEFESLLKRKLGLAPSVQMTELVAALTRHDAVPAAGRRSG